MPSRRSLSVIYSSHSSMCVCQSLPLPAWRVHPSPHSAPWAASALASQRVTRPLHYPPSAPRCILNLNSASAQERDPWHSALGLQRRPEWADQDNVSSGAAAQPGSGGVGLKGGSAAQRGRGWQKAVRRKRAWVQGQDQQARCAQARDGQVEARLHPSGCQLLARSPSPGWPRRFHRFN